MTVNPIQQKIIEYKSILGLSNWVQAIFAISGILYVISLFSGYLQSQLINKILSGSYVSLAEANANDSREALIGYIQIAFLIIGIIIFLIWVYRANKNLYAFSYPILEFTPGWSVGWFFVPIASLFQPYRVMSEISRASNPNIDSIMESEKKSPTPAIVILWWAFFLISNYVGWFALRYILQGETITDLLNSTYAYMVSDAVDLIGIIVTIAMVRKISQSQELRFQYTNVLTTRYQADKEDKTDERRACLTYYEEEKKLGLLYERVEQLFGERVSKYEHALSQARKDKESIMDGVLANLEKIAEVYEHIQQAANDIVERKKGMITAPSAALAMSSAWEAVYLDYIDFRSPSSIIAGSHGVELEAKRARARLTAQKFNNSLRKAWKEEIEFRKRLKLNISEYQRIIENATRAVAADECSRKLEAECP